MANEAGWLRRVAASENQAVAKPHTASHDARGLAIQVQGGVLAKRLWKHARMVLAGREPAKGGYSHQDFDVEWNAGPLLGKVLFGSSSNAKSPRTPPPRPPQRLNHSGSFLG